MCGIAGFLTHSFENLTEQHLIEMGNSISHRGPDAHGEYLDNEIGLCHRRLSIIDLSEAGNQPMFSNDNNIVIVFNGEIYNFPELRDELIEDEVVFQSNTDTEVIIYLYKKYGIDCLAKLNGMFAFALWDKKQKTLFIARDRLGKKPLYYLGYNGRFAFASEIKAILTLPNVPREIRLDAVYDFFAYQYVPDPKSIFKNIHKLPPAHYMLVKNGEIDIQQYWDVDFTNTTDKPEAELKDDLLKLANACTKRRMMSDVPLGAFLSGGIDSSALVTIMSKHSAAPVKTCTIGFNDKKFNESEFAGVIAQEYKTEHYEFQLSQNVSEHLERIVSFFDEPFADPSLVPTFFVSELARKVVTVAIAGDGGDEVFAGYEKYNTDNIENNLRRKFPKWLRASLFPLLVKAFSVSEHPLMRKAHSLFTSLNVSPEMGFYITNSQIKDKEWSAIAKPEIREALGSYHPSQASIQTYNNAKGSDHLSKILYTDIKTYLPGGILVKVDRMSMANSLEVRAPLLDKQMLEFAAKVPSSLKFNNGQKKYLLKEAFKSQLPKDILYRKKMGFSVPLACWFREEIKEVAYRYIKNDKSGLSHFFNMDVIEKYWQEHQTKKADHSTILWSMLMFEMWWQRYMEVGS